MQQLTQTLQLTELDLTKLLPEISNYGKRIISKKINENKIEVYVKKAAGKAGHNSKKIIINESIILDSLFFEGLGLWLGEGAKNKGLYFANSCIEILLHFLKFVEERLGMSRTEFKVTIVVPELNTKDYEIKMKWAEKLKIPFENFTDICIDPRMNEEHLQIYFNSIILAALMRILIIKLKQNIISNSQFSVPFLRGFIAAEGAVILKEWGTVAHVAVANKDMEIIKFITDCLRCLDITRGKYFEDSAKFPIYGRRNFDKLAKLKLLELNPFKFKKFNNGMKKFTRFPQKKEEMEILILQQLKTNSKTYDELAELLNKRRSTIQSHYIPILEKKGLLERVGKKKQALLFALTESGKNLILP